MLPTFGFALFSFHLFYARCSKSHVQLLIRKNIIKINTKLTLSLATNFEPELDDYVNWDWNSTTTLLIKRSALTLIAKRNDIKEEICTWVEFSYVWCVTKRAWILRTGWKYKCQSPKWCKNTNSESEIGRTKYGMKNRIGW